LRVATALAPNKSSTHAAQLELVDMSRRLLRFVGLPACKVYRTPHGQIPWSDQKGETMADLDADKREKLDSKDFGLPEKARTKEAKRESGNYPMPDDAHARNAKARAAQQQKAGNLSKKDKERIDRKADKILDE
jgi:hypothetical protein